MRIKALFLTILMVWAAAAALPREEYPRPQFERADWQNLNGPWTYTFDMVSAYYPDSRVVARPSHDAEFRSR